ncbi:hypothetical protein KIW84_072488 [Lathyrus oleraceus]|uniref:Uncharacterized protein n=1 Tax=Pisum sativum TaxID=3888 RepID=A0A9D4VL43_PEA|nr:hypothetical protein KIW84_072488 [Pisum sativum]
MGLLIASRVRIPNVVPFEIKTKVNDTYVDKFCLDKKKKRRQVEKTGKTLSNTLKYGDWDPRLRQAFTFTWDQNDSNHMAVISLHDSFYRKRKLATKMRMMKKRLKRKMKKGTPGGSKTTSDDDTTSDDGEGMGGE